MDNVAHQYQLADPVPQEEEALPFLPDDVLVEVFKYLSVPELFAARRACRRWAALALHADVWRQREVYDCEEGEFRAALSLAPCVRTLQMFDSFDLDAAACLARPLGRDGSRLDVLAATTRCAAEHLDLDLLDIYALTATRILRNQEQLGRLRTLTLAIDGIDSSSPLNGNVSHLLFATIATKGLAEMHLTIVSGEMSDLDWHWLPAPSASLKKLVCRLGSMSWFPIVLHLIGCHADTLESLLLNRPVGVASHPLWDRPEAESVASRVAGLRELGCPLLRGMGALVRCSMLEFLCLHLDTDRYTDVAVLRDAKEYLRQATQLRWFVVDAPEDSAEFRRIAVDLVEALASSRRSAVKNLSLKFPWDSQSADGALLDRLSNALGLLPALNEVHVVVESADVLLALMECVSVAAGRDRPLTLRVTRGSTRWCEHAWVHQDEAKIVEIFKKCPTFHVLTGSFYCSRTTPDECPACALRCHQAAGACRGVVLFGHPEDDEECDAPQHADEDVVGHRVGRQH